MEDFLKDRPPYTFLPSLRPMDSKTTSNMEWYGDTETQDRLAIIQACLHDQYDVARAENILASIRMSRGKMLLDTRMYNSFLEAYLAMSQREPDNADIWLGRMWNTYEFLEKNDDGLVPSPSTYAIMLVSLDR